jgi:hypothetical protein
MPLPLPTAKLVALASRGEVVWSDLLTFSSLFLTGDDLWWGRSIDRSGGWVGLELRSQPP